jgi:NAD(P)-dependent dehydrogenase (short-subunit alcohol dehydrogenase family)
MATIPSTINHQPSTALGGRIALITGASRGIGAAVARRFAAEGAHVILAARNVAGLEETDDAIRAEGGNATLVQLDVTKPDQIEMLAKQIAQRFGKLDILVGNAGILGELSPVAHTTPEHWERVINTNLTANFHLLRCFDALLQCSDAPRAIFVTSGVGKNVRAYWGAYAISKAALDMMARLYAAENENSKLKVNIINPGQVRTHMNAQAFPGADPMTRVSAESITDIFVQLASPACTVSGETFNAQ